MESSQRNSAERGRTDVWKMFGGCSEDVRKMFGGCLEEQMFGRCSEDVQRTVGRCSEDKREGDAVKLVSAEVSAGRVHVADMQKEEARITTRPVRATAGVIKETASSQRKRTQSVM